MKGLDGVLVSVVAVIATVLLASTVGALTTETVETTDYTYQANINGIYDVSQIPVPTPYSPAGNFNSWATSESNAGSITGGISYSTLDRYNGIPVLSAGQTTTRSGTIPILFPNAIPPATEGKDTYTWLFVDENGNLKGAAYACNFSEFRDFLFSGDTAKIYDRWRIPMTDIGLAKITDFEVESVAGNEVLSYTGMMPAAVEISTGNDTVSLFDVGGNLYDTVIADELVMGYGTGESTEIPWLGDSYTATGTKTQSTSYMDTTKGIKITGSPAYWKNGYKTTVISFLWDGSGTTTFTMPLKTVLGNNGAGTATLGLTSSNSGLTASFTHGGITKNIDLGKWPAGYLELDLYNGTIKAAGVDILRDYRDYDLSNVIQKRNLSENKTYFETMTATGDIDFTIDSTSVLLTSSASVMIDPSVDIGQHFPQLADAWRVTYDSIVTYGDSITINGQTYTISNKKIVNAPYDYNGEVAYKDMDLVGLSITCYDHETIIKYISGESYTEPTTNPVMAFDGIWYFDADLYSVSTGMEEVYVYSGGFGMDAAGAMATYIVMVMIGSFVIVKYKNPGIIDWGIVLFSIAAAWVII